MEAYCVYSDALDRSWLVLIEGNGHEAADQVKENPEYQRQMKEVREMCPDEPDDCLTTKFLGRGPFVMEARDVF